MYLGPRSSSQTGASDDPLLSLSTPVLSRRQMLGLAAGTSALLASCRQQARPQPGVPAATARPVRIELATDWNSPPRKDVLDLMKDEFQKRYPNVTIEHQYVTAAGGSAEGYTEKMLAQVLAGTPPDIIANWAYHPYVEHLADLTKDAPAMGWKKTDVVYDPFNQEVDGKLYMLSMSTSVSGWIYNKTMFASAGLKEPDDTWTLNNVLEAALRLTDPAKQQFGAHAPNGFWFGFLEILWAAGAGSTGPTSAEMFSITQKRSRLAEARGPDAFEWYIDLIHKHKVAPTQQDMQAGAQFVNGKIGMQPFGIYNSGSMARRIGDSFEWSGMPIPKDPATGRRSCDRNSEGFVIPKITRDRGTYETALAYVLSFYSDPVMQAVARTRSTLPIMRKWIESPEYLSPPPLGLDVIVRTLNDRQMILGDHQQRYPRFRQWIQAVRDELNKAFSGENAAKQALAAAMAAGDRVLAAG